MNKKAPTLAQKKAALESSAHLMKVMAHPCRLCVLCALSEGEHHVSALQDRVGGSQSALSQHLAVLRKAGLVKTRREAQTIFYALSGLEILKIIDILHDLHCPDPAAHTGC
jgi:ArsR family transcriptional regulator, virulence genes transcriptional regulator